MVLGTVPHHARSYKVETPVFQGPLDLLLHLIERAELDITELALAQVTDQYLEHLRLIEETAPEEVSAFLVIAARLIQVKSEALLPRPPVREPDEDDPGQALAMQLLAYKRYKEIAELLARREALGLHTYLRLAPPIKTDTSLDPSWLTTPALAEAARLIFLHIDTRPALRTVVSPSRVTIREKIGLIAQYLRENRQVTFRILLMNKTSHLDIVVTFLAMLELIKRDLIEARQDSLFADIELETTGNWEGNDQFELEFGE